VGLLGPNGAGKTTTLSVLATLRRPDAGQAWVDGWATDREGAAVRRVLGYVPQGLAVYPTLTARENLRCFAGLLGGAGAIDAVLAAVGLTDRADDVVATYSGGMQRRLNLACGIVHRPRVLLLDEPTVGVDPQSRERIFAAVRAQAAAGAAVLYTTHYMEEAEQLCDRVVLLDAGRVVASGTPAALVQAHARGVRVEIVTRERLPHGWLVRVPEAQPQPLAAVGEGPPRTTVSIAAVASAPRLLEAVAACGAELLEFRVVRPSLQDVFLDLTGRALRD
jgi:ABC-2 type transport system ATP-binding protein